MLKPSKKDSLARATTLNLPEADKALLRATTPAVLLGGIGHRMRGSIGGIGRIVESGDDAYAKSFPVDRLDIFLSHSWHTRWYLKYLTLLYFFNAMPAIATTCFVSGICAVCLWQPGGPEGESHEDNTHHLTEMRPICQVVGTLTFVATLLSWHHVLAALHWAPTLFLDKVCIHQTDLQLKTRGIQYIGAFLAKSNMMLVTWDGSYFERLWCTYEMSAFRAGNPEGKVRVLPVILGGFTVAYSVATAIADVLLHGFQRLGSLTDPFEIYCASALFHFPMYVLCMRLVVRYINNYIKLKEQLAHFSVRSAKCFCCSCQHVHPDTGAALPCDRVVVNNSIEKWMGLDEFDRMVRGHFMHFVRRSLGGWAKIPYRYAVAASIYPGLWGVDHMAAQSTWSFWLKALWVFDTTFLRHPLIIALVVAAHVRYQLRVQVWINHCLQLSERWKESCTKYLMYITSGLASTVLYYVSLITKKWLMSKGVWKKELLLVLWMVCEAFCVFMFYFQRVLMQDYGIKKGSWVTEEGNPAGLTTLNSRQATQSNRTSLDTGHCVIELGAIPKRLETDSSTAEGCGEQPTVAA